MTSVRVFYPKWTRASLLEVLRARVGRLAEALPLSRVVLFGSWASDRATAFSDIDLLVVYRGEPQEGNYALVRRALGISGLELHLYSEGEYGAVKATLERMTEAGIVLLPDATNDPIGAPG